MELRRAQKSWSIKERSYKGLGASMSGIAKKLECKGAGKQRNKSVKQRERKSVKLWRSGNM